MKWNTFANDPDFWCIDIEGEIDTWLRAESVRGEVGIDKSGEIWLTPDKAREFASIIMKLADHAEQTLQLKAKKNPTRKKGAKK